MQPDHEYPGLVASSWDLLRGDTSRWPDRSFYREVIQRFGEPALDVGCANGRLLLDYASLGVDIDGVDVSPDMLATCRARALQLGLDPRLFEQRMEALGLPRRCKTILVPSSSFQLLTGPEEARTALADPTSRSKPRSSTGRLGSKRSTPSEPSPGSPPSPGTGCSAYSGVVLTRTATATPRGVEGARNVPRTRLIPKGVAGAAGRTRTGDLLITKSRTTPTKVPVAPGSTSAGEWKPRVPPRTAATDPWSCTHHPNASLPAR